jgi:hypothetical protein
MENPLESFPRAMSRGEDEPFIGDSGRGPAVVRVRTDLLEAA